MASHWSNRWVLSVNLGQTVNGLGIAVDDGYIARLLPENKFVVKEQPTNLVNMFVPFDSREEVWSKMDELADDDGRSMEEAMERQRRKGERSRRYAALYLRLADLWVSERMDLPVSLRRARDDKFERILARISRVVTGSYKTSSRTDGE